MILIDAIAPDIFTSLLQYGVLGIFSILMILIIRYQNTTNKEQQAILISTFNKQNDELRAENTKQEIDRKDLNDQFLCHLKETELKLLSIISENTNAFTQIATSNDNMTDAITLLIDRLGDNSKSNKELNDNILKIIK